MLSLEHNELLTKTGPGTLMGDLIRRYWVPALLSEEVPEPDGAPRQVRLLGEELVSFRDSQGRVGLLDEHCSHRGTSLFYGRNEECGLRCVYHGWKYDVEGRVLETSAEPAESRFRDKLRHPAYPTQEVGGIVWAYLGPPELRPQLPNYAWALLPTTHTYVNKSLLECNWLQGLEGECDSSHLNFLHWDFTRQHEPAEYQMPQYETEDTDFGVRLIALRDAPPDETYVRISSFVIPLSCWVPAGGRHEVHMYAPADDAHTWRYDFGFCPDGPWDGQDHRRGQMAEDYRRIRTAANHYLVDREMQRAANYTGIPDFLNHDAMATESMGKVFDRRREHLGASDKAVIAVRRRLLQAVDQFQRGETPPHVVSDPEQSQIHIDTFARNIPSTSTWRQEFEHLTTSSPSAPSSAHRGSFQNDPHEEGKS